MKATDLLKVDAKTKVLATMILAHGAGAPMDSSFMNALCEALADRGISTFRFEFPYMAKRRKDGKKYPPDRQPVLLDQWREVYAAVKTQNPAGRLLIGGKSMGGRMASVIAEELRPEGFCCFGYPFHPPGKKDRTRTEHFKELSVPGLILQGTRDPFGKPNEIDASEWPDNIKLVWLEEGDHDYRARKKSGLSQSQIILNAASAVAAFIAQFR